LVPSRRESAQDGWLRELIEELDRKKRALSSKKTRSEERDPLAKSQCDSRGIGEDAKGRNSTTFFLPYYQRSTEGDGSVHRESITRKDCCTQ